MANALGQVGSPRYFGSAALHMAWLAQGSCDLVYYEYAKLGPWDVAAGIALCEAVGLEARWLAPAVQGLPARFIAGPHDMVDAFLSLTRC
jgi:fructose-1,6-bisphosphatase/inositol monophosphatase family enzyme